MKQPVRFQSRKYLDLYLRFEELGDLFLRISLKAADAGAMANFTVSYK